MTENETFSLALNLAIVGLVTVFLVLAAVAGGIALLTRLEERLRVRAERRPKRPVHEPTPTIDDTTLVLITAAVATLLKGRGHIRRIRRLHPTHGNQWSQQGRAELQGSHVVLRNK